MPPGSGCVSPSLCDPLIPSLPPSLSSHIPPPHPAPPAVPPSWTPPFSNVRPSSLSHSGACPDYRGWTDKLWGDRRLSHGCAPTRALARCNLGLEH